MQSRLDSEPRSPAALAHISVDNREVAPAKPNEFRPLEIGSLRIWPPVVLAPMAGVTNYPFRAVCREQGAGLYVSEMITARPLAEGREKTLRLAGFGPDETPRSLQLYGVDPVFVGQAVERLVSEGRVDHIDMNFGCPVRKVTRKGGGAALPLKRKLLASIIRAAVRAAEPSGVPVTIKFRLGVNEDLLTFRDTGRIAEAEGVRAVGLHARTAADLYDGHARWEAIGELKQLLSIPVLGNGDIWEAADALRMMRSTGCDGVIVGRGCLGRPWLFRELAQMFSGDYPQEPPNLGQVLAIMTGHAERLAAWISEPAALRAFRRQASWYTKGFRGSAQARARFMEMETLDEMREIIGTLNGDEPFPLGALRVPRGKSSGTQTVSLPADYLLDLDDDTPPEDDGTVDGG
jgi:nifR3 family TIM-barrel protein